MKINKGFILFITVSIWIIACAKTTLPLATETDAEKVSDKYPGITAQELAQGQVLYEQHCGNCHKLYSPDSRTDAQWKDVVPPMANKAKIDDKSEGLILNYLVSMANRSNE